MSNISFICCLTLKYKFLIHFLHYLLVLLFNPIHGVRVDLRVGCSSIYYAFMCLSLGVYSMVLSGKKITAAPKVRCYSELK